MTNLLSGKTALITGASSGIGRAAATLFAQHGANVVLGARGHSRLDDIAAEIKAAGGHVATLAGDVRDPAYAPALVDLAESRFGGLDAALNNAGAMVLGDLTEQVTPEDWSLTIDTNLTANLHAIQAQVPALRRRGGGSLVFTSSFVGYTVSFPTQTAYAASKAGLIGLVKATAVEFGPENIRINALLPGGTDTPMYDQFAPTPEEKAGVASLMALGRVAEPREIAQAALYLASDLASFQTGTAMLVDGGLSVKG